MLLTLSVVVLGDTSSEDNNEIAIDKGKIFVDWWDHQLIQTLLFITLFTSLTLSLSLHSTSYHHIQYP